MVSRSILLVDTMKVLSKHQETWAKFKRPSGKSTAVFLFPHGTAVFLFGLRAQAAGKMVACCVYQRVSGHALDQLFKSTQFPFFLALKNLRCPRQEIRQCVTTKLVEFCSKVASPVQYWHCTRLSRKLLSPEGMIL